MNIEGIGGAGWVRMAALQIPCTLRISHCEEVVDLQKEVGLRKGSGGAGWARMAALRIPCILQSSEKVLAPLFGRSGVMFHLFLSA